MLVVISSIRKFLQAMNSLFIDSRTKLVFLLGLFRQGGIEDLLTLYFDNIYIYIYIYIKNIYERQIGG